MKKLLRFLLPLCLPVLLISCEEGLFGSPVEREPECLETWQDQNNGLTIERVYANRRITELRYLHFGELASYYTFTYGEDGRISESQYVDVANNSEYPPLLITYNTNGKWAEVSRTYPNGEILTNNAVYDDQGQIQEITSLLNESGVISENYTVTFTWEGGNNTVRNFISPTNQVETHYVFDPSKENRRKSEQEKLSFLSTAVSYNKNMYSYVVTTSTNDSTSSETEIHYNYQLNEEGYPIYLTQIIETDAGSSTIEQTDYAYNCY